MVDALSPALCHPGSERLHLVEALQNHQLSRLDENDLQEAGTLEQAHRDPRSARRLTFKVFYCHLAILHFSTVGLRFHFVLGPANCGSSQGSRLGRATIRPSGPGFLKGRGWVR